MTVVQALAFHHSAVCSCFVAPKCILMVIAASGSKRGRKEEKPVEASKLPRLPTLVSLKVELPSDSIAPEAGGVEEHLASGGAVSQHL